MLLVMFLGVAKLENICFERKIWVREAKMFLTPGDTANQNGVNLF